MILICGKEWWNNASRKYLTVVLVKGTLVTTICVDPGASALPFRVYGGLR